MDQAFAPVYAQAGSNGCLHAVHPVSIQLHPHVLNQHNQPVVIVQPSANMRHQPQAKPVPDYMGYSIFSTLCCCLCLGLCALQYSRDTRSANAAGQRREAAKSSQTALILNHVAVIVGIILLGAYVLNTFYLSGQTDS
ncbi:synapse differentiation-inducing gene protein 1-like [Puntigrus tetrazona]|uniref:synapse differentiation-inducing gene protein 1-like n=1 Tax=Puntigrus tetrazona TaxID=1606681 RepID=UPI001C8ADDDC|nr:synapse differentiation-inducing gene protein 1-like [Puntigrus tetrazona]